MRCLLVSLVLLLGLTACGGGGSDDTPPPVQREPLNFTAAYVVQDATGAAQARLAASAVALGPPAAGGIDRIALTPDATRVLMLARDDPASPSALFGVAVATPTTRDRLSPDGPAGHRGVDDMVLSPDGTTVAFRGDLQTATLGQVFQAGVDGSTPARAIGVVIQTVDNELLGPATWSPDGRYFAYGKRSRGTGVRFSILVKEGTFSPPDPLAYDNATDIREPHWTPDGSTQVYTQNTPTDPRQQLYAKPIGDPTQTLLNEALSDDSTVDRVRVSPDGATVAYRVRSGSGARLMRTGLGGTGQVAVAADTGPFEFSRDGRWLLYADGAGRLMRQALSAPSSPPEPIDAPLPAGHGILDIVPIADAVVVRTGRVQGQAVSAARLWHATLAATPVVTALSPDTTGAGVQADFAVASDGRSVAYRADLRQTGQFELQASRLSEPGVAETLSGTLAPGEQVTAVAVR